MKSLFFLLLTLLTVIHSQLLYVTQLFRHGARYTNHKFYDYNDTWQDQGQLTGVGMRQHYNLGSYLRKDYIQSRQFLNSTFDHKEFEIFSTQSHRTVESALSQLMGLYPEASGAKVPSGVQKELLLPPYEGVSDQVSGEWALPRGTQAFPMHNGAQYLGNCPNSDNMAAQMVVHYAKEYAAQDLIYTPLFLRMRELFGIIPAYQINLLTMTLLYDTLVADQFLGRKLPAGFDQRDLDNLRHLTHWLMTLSYSGQFSAALSTPLFTKIFSDFDQKLSHINSSKKWTMLSGHDTNVAPTLTFLNLTNFKCIEDKYEKNDMSGYLNCEDGPDFAANLLVELWKEGGEDVVKVKYNGKYVNLCEKKETKCGYQEFKSRVEGQYVDYKKLCGLTKQEVQDSKGMKELHLKMEEE